VNAQRVRAQRFSGTVVVAVAALVATLGIAAYVVAVTAGDAGTARPPGSTPAPADGPDLATVTHPLRCQEVGTVVDREVRGDLTGDGIAEVVVAVRCDAGAGSPPNAVLLYGGGPDGAARLLSTLVPTDADVQVQRLALTGGEVEVTGLTYSSAQVPRCCPDEQFLRRWRWAGDRVVPA
jgi:hypothetical protein